MSETIRTIREADVDGAAAANAAVGWKQRRGLIDFHRRRDDTTVLVAEVDGQIAGGGATVFPGTPRTGWVHGYVTRIWLGTPPPWRPEMIFGVFNFGVG